ncbi:MAG: TonB family protein [Saprospiraceae bacterium]|nr:TonB family protein [Saprospiraceae bacterium]
MALYLLESSLCWLLFYGFYALTLSRETFFGLNRWYLLSTLALGAVIPLLEIPVEWIIPTPEISLSAWLPMAEIGGMGPEIVVIPAPAKPSLFQTLVLPVYWAGVAFAGVRFVVGLVQIFLLYVKGSKKHFVGHTVVTTTRTHLPFSFGNWLFISRHNNFSTEETEKIVRHELAHIRGWHTADVLLLEIVCILLWWSPPVYLYRRSLRTVHEYLADHAVLQTVRRKEYGHLLIRQAQSGMQPALANHFFHSQLKKRIMMMTKTQSGKTARLKYLTVFPLLVLAMLLFANREVLAQVSITEKNTIAEPAATPDAAPAKSPAKIRITESEKSPESYALLEGKAITVIGWGNPANPEHPLYFIDGQEVTQEDLNGVDPGDIAQVEVLKGESAIAAKGPRAAHGAVLVTTKNAPGNPDEMPRFPGCEAVKDVQERTNCAFGKLMEFIGANLKYPQAARDASIEGTVVASFTVNADGSLSDVTIVKSIGGGTDEEVKRVIGLMPKWIPAQKGGKAVKSEMKLPVKFKLDAGQQPAAKSMDEETFKVVEEMPRFPGSGCETSDSDQVAKKQCADKAMLEFIYKGIKYPKAARDAGTEGTVVVSFIVDKSGKIRDASILRGIGNGCDEEVLRLVGEMPDWIPGKQRGRDVNVQFNLPIKFKLEAPAPKTDDLSKPQPAFPAKKKALEPSRFSASPNPASKQVRVYFEADVKPVTVRIMDAAQKVIFEQQVEVFNGVYDKTINLGSAPKGVAYIVVSQEGLEPFVHKLVVQ